MDVRAAPPRTCRPAARAVRAVLTAVPSRPAAPGMSEQGVDMRAALEKKYGIAPRSSLHARLAGGAPRAPAAPRSDVARAKEFGLW